MARFLGGPRKNQGAFFSGAGKKGITMNTKMTKAIIVSILTALVVFFSSATMSEPSESLLIVGPASKATNNSLQIMGQDVILQSSNAGDDDEVERPESGSYIAVFGYISKKGKLIATRIDELDTQYVPGASPVMVSGLVEHSMDQNGRVTLGELTMDVTSSISTVPDIHSEGLVVCTGVQPNPDGIMLEYTNAGFDSYQSFANYQNSTSGEFLASIESGTSPFSIGGGDGYSIGGGDGFSIDGGGKEFDEDDD